MRREPRPRPEHGVALGPRPRPDDALGADLHGVGKRGVLAEHGAGADPQQAPARVHARAVADRHAVADQQPRAGVGAQDHVAADPDAGAQLDARPRPARAPPAGAGRDHRIGADRAHGGQI